MRLTNQMDKQRMKPSHLVTQKKRSEAGQILHTACFARGGQSANTVRIRSDNVQGRQKPIAREE
jgi:hypothetical protein